MSGDSVWNSLELSECVELYQQTSLQQLTTDGEALETIINNLGGLNKIVWLCLTSEKYCKQNVTLQNMENLRNLINSLDTNTQSTIASKETHNLELANATQEAIASDLPTATANANATSPISPITTISNVTNSVQAPILDISEFERHKTVFSINCHNNFYFKYLPLNAANFIYYKIILTKRYPVFVTCLAILLVGISQTIRWLADDTNMEWETVKDLTKLVFFVWGAFFALSYIFSGNINLYKRLLNSFHFWFQIVNVIQLTIASKLISSRAAQNYGYINSSLYESVETMFVLTVMTFFITMDAWFASTRIRISVAAIVTLIFIYNFVVTFLEVDETEMNWNVFQE